MLALLCGFLLHPLHAAEVYKCIDDNGRPEFSQRPCSPDATTTNLSPIPPIDAGAAREPGISEQYDTVTAKLDDRINKASIATAEDDINAYIKERDLKISVYEKQWVPEGGDRVYHAFAVSRNRWLRDQIRDLFSQYDKQIAAKTAEIRKLQKKLHTPDPDSDRPPGMLDTPAEWNKRYRIESGTWRRSN
ncbi:DUF4124 domain-containing protein [Candidatus Thiodictyon syntrophicum]|uniref:DUF4124 domain-containing protein n=1 Tax=Candidatus Thiodictyon syntrophicum TaxID=1166950 RepID=UPI0012FD868F|nr:DUF4124 domain-containing protein [Candidatus Thiodictyon syntrophicum]